MHHFYFSLIKPAYFNCLKFLYYFLPCDPGLPLSLKMSDQTRRNTVRVQIKSISFSLKEI